MAEMRVMSVISSNQIVGGSSWSIYEGIWALKDGFEANYFLNNFMSAAPSKGVETTHDYEGWCGEGFEGEGG